jgi:hypothetical protein
MTKYFVFLTCVCVMLHCGIYEMSLGIDSIHSWLFVRSVQVLITIMYIWGMNERRIHE